MFKTAFSRKDKLNFRVMLGIRANQLLGSVGGGLDSKRNR